jgi:hypothetical protein
MGKGQQGAADDGTARNSGPGTRSRFFRVGPALAAALAIAALILWQRWRWERTPRPVVVEHQTVRETGLVAVPDPPFVLARADALRLSATQRAQVRRLSEEYTRARAPLLARAGAVTADATAKLDQLRESGKPARLDAASPETDAIAQASRSLSEVRVRTWPRLAALLTAEQAKAARAAWAGAHTLPSPQPRAGGER